MSDRFSPENNGLSAGAIGRTPYAELDSAQRDAIFMGTVAPLRIIEVAMAQQPPNEAIIVAIHMAARGRDALIYGAPGFIIDGMRDGPGELTQITVEAQIALGKIAAARAPESS